MERIAVGQCQSWCQGLEDLIVSPGLSPLREAGPAACHDVFESCWSWAEGTGWILAEPLFAIIW